MPGSKSDPVVLDPLQTIIEVGWGTITHVVYSFAMSVSRTSGGESGCPPNTNRPTGPNWGSYKKTSALAYNGITTKLRKNGTWIDTTGHTVSVTRPDLPAFAYSNWQYVDGAGSYGDGTTAWVIQGGIPRLFQPSGSSFDIKSPGGIAYKSAAKIDGDYFGDVFTGDPVCTETGIKEAPCTGTAIIGDTSSYQSYSTFEIARSGFSAIVDEKNFSPVGMLLTGGSAWGGQVRENATISILMKRV